MLLPLIVIFGLFTAVVKTLPPSDKKEWSAMTPEEQAAELSWIQYQNQRAIENSKNEFERIPIQK